MPRATSEQSTSSHGRAPSGAGVRQKRPTACVNCRRQKVKCDATLDNDCTRCRTEDIECIVRPRTNAAVVVDDLRWQQSVEGRLQQVLKEIAEIREQQQRIGARSTTTPNDTSHPGPINDSPHHNEDMESDFTSRLLQPLPDPFPPHLFALRETLRPALQELQKDGGSVVTIEEATKLWEYFHASLGIFHGFTASPESGTPSPLLFSAIVTAAAKRYDVALVAPISAWEELFQKALLRLMYEIRPKTWDDVVGLGIARTWFWKADEITSGMIYGAYLETLSPTLADGGRSRRIWDFLEMTSVSHGILHLSTPIVPDRPPIFTQPRGPSHVLLGALNELFDILGPVNRSLRTAQSLVKYALRDKDVGGDSRMAEMPYSELTVLRKCRSDLEPWWTKWQRELLNAEEGRLPAARSEAFLLDLLEVYRAVARVIIDGYLHQGPPDSPGQYAESSNSLLELVTTRWSESLHLWPKLFLHSSLIAALHVPHNGPAARLHTLLMPLVPVLQTTGRQLMSRLATRLNEVGVSSNFIPNIFSPLDRGLNLDSIMEYSSSDFLWGELSAALGTDTLPELSSSHGHSASGLGSMPNW